MIQDTNIEQFIPQRPPFVMVEKLLEAKEESSKTSFTIEADNILVKNGSFTESGLVENMAQTVAAGTGATYQEKNEQVPVGFIGALKSLNVMELPKVGDTITTEVKLVTQVMNASVVQAKTFIGDKEIANCELKIFLQTNN